MYLLVFNLLGLMLVTVIMNTVNERADVLKKAIESYLDQVDVNVELIVSTIEGDPNIPLMESLGVTKIVTMPLTDHPLSQGIKSPVGSYLQLNNALPHMTGDCFCFASGNDYAYKNKLKIETDVMKTFNCEIVYSSFSIVHPSGRVLKKLGFHEYDYFKHMKGNFVSDCALISRRIIKKYGPFNVEMKNFAFWDFWLRVYEGEGNIFKYNPRPTWAYVQNPDDMHNKRRRDSAAILENERDRKFMLSNHGL